MIYILICNLYFKIKQFMEILKKETNSNKSQIFSMKRLQEIAIDKNFVMGDFSEFLMKLNENGILLKMGNNTFKFVSS